MKTRWYRGCICTLRRVCQSRSSTDKAKSLLPPSLKKHSPSDDVLATLFMLQRIHICQSKPPHEKKGWIAQSSSLTPANRYPRAYLRFPASLARLKESGELDPCHIIFAQKESSNPSKEHGVGLWSQSPKRVKGVNCVIFRHHPVRLSTEDTNQRGQF